MGGDLVGQRADWSTLASNELHSGQSLWHQRCWRHHSSALTSSCLPSHLSSIVRVWRRFQDVVWSCGSWAEIDNVRNKYFKNYKLSLFGLKRWIASLFLFCWSPHVKNQLAEVMNGMSTDKKSRADRRDSNLWGFVRNTSDRSRRSVKSRNFGSNHLSQELTQMQ